MNEKTQEQTNCMTVEDLIQPRNLAILGRVMREYLDSRAITALELIHWAPYGRHLHDAGTTLAAAVQKVAIAQVQVTRRPVGERVKELFALSESAITWADGLGKNLPKPPLTGAIVSTLASSLHDEGPARAVASIARHLECSSSWTVKAARCAALVDEQASPKAVGMIDNIVAEIFSSDAAVDVLTGKSEMAEGRIGGLLALSASEPEFQNEAAIAPELARLQHLIVAGRLHETRTACRNRIIATLNGPMRMASKSPFEEFKSLAIVSARLKKAVSLGGANDLAEGIEKRMARIVTGENFSSFVEGCSGFGQKILRVIWVIDRTQGAAPRQELMKYLAHLLQHRDIETQFAPAGAAAADRLALAESVLKALMDSHMAENRREAFLEVIKPLVQKMAGGERRNNSRQNAGTEDHVILNGIRLPMRNWSPSGLLFGPMANPPPIGAKITLTVIVRTKTGSIRFEAEAEILRLLNGEVGARYICRTPAVQPEINAFFTRKD